MSGDAATLWLRVAEGLRRDLGARTFDHWLKPVRFADYCTLSGVVTLETASRFSANWINERFGDRLARLDLADGGAHVEREIALVKVAGTGDKRIEALRMADVFRAKVVDTTLTSFIFEITGTSDKVDRFIALMRECGLVEVGRTGVVAIARGPEAL